jgi:hypothetical protein
MNTQDINAGASIVPSFKRRDFLAAFTGVAATLALGRPTCCRPCHTLTARCHR